MCMFHNKMLCRWHKYDKIDIGFKVKNNMILIINTEKWRFKWNLTR